MKTLMLVCSLVLSSTAFAQTITCSPDASEIVAAIETAESCYQATQIAETCAWGSSVDVAIAGTAYGVCAKEAGTLSKADQKLLTSMEARCAKAWGNREGTLYRSTHSFCKLEAISFINSVANSEEY